MDTHIHHAMQTSLKRTLIFPIMVIGLFVSGIYVWFLQQTLLDTLEKQLYNRAVLVTNMLNHTAEIVHYDVALQRVVSATGAESDILDIIIVGGEPCRVIASTKTQWQGKLLNELPDDEYAGDLSLAMVKNKSHCHFNESEHLFDYSSPLSISQDSLVGGISRKGAIMVHLDTRPMHVVLKEAGLRIGILCIVSLLLLALIGYVLLVRKVLQPLARINRAVKKGEYATAHDWGLSARQDEIGMLAQALQGAISNTQAALRERDNHQLAIDKHAIVAVTDPQGVIVYVNDKFCAVSLYSREELVGQTHKIIKSGVHPPKFYKEMWTTLISGVTWQGDLCNRAKDSTEYWVSSTIMPLFDVQGKVHSYISISTDITQNKRQELQLLAASVQSEALINELGVQAADANRMAAQAEMANLAKSSFLANMSHELRTPMNGILGTTELLLGTDLNVEQRDLATTTYRSGQGLLTLLNDILDFSKIEAGMMTIESIPMDVRQIIYDVAELYVARWKDQQVELLVRIDPALPTTVVGDPGRIRQILLNLVGNAAKFTEHGHVLVDCSWSDGMCTISVIDTGIGIPADRLSQLFAAFVQADNSTSRRFGGTGLGLVISRRIAEMMKGTLTVTSVLGQGSNFTAHIPLGVPAHSVTPVEVDNSLAGARILIVDDHEISGSTIRQQLVQVGARAEHISHAALALVTLAAENKGADPFVAVLIDQHMPVMQGTELASAINAEGLSAPVPLILLTTTSVGKDASQFIASGFSGYVTKPCRLDVLSGVIAACRSRNGREILELINKHNMKKDFKKGSSDTALLEIPKPGLKGSVLLVEDNRVNQMVGRLMLQHIGMSVTIANDGQEACLAIEKNAYDIVFMDCQMPVMDGYEATAVIRTREARLQLDRIAIIAMTANAMSGDRELCLSAGMDDHIAKPVTEQTITEALYKWLKRPPDTNKSLQRKA